MSVYSATLIRQIEDYKIEITVFGVPDEFGKVIDIEWLDGYSSNTIKNEIDTHFLNRISLEILCSNVIENIFNNVKNETSGFKGITISITHGNYCKGTFTKAYS